MRNRTTFEKGDPRTQRIAHLGKAASPWNRPPTKATALRTMRLKALKDAGRALSESMK